MTRGAAPMHIGIAGPIAGADVAHLVAPAPGGLPRGYPGAPFLATLIDDLLQRGHRVTAFTLSSDLPLQDDATFVARGQAFRWVVVPMRPKAWPFNGRRCGRIVDLYAFERGGLERAIRAAAPDVVHAHWSYEFAWAALASGVPAIVTCHDSPTTIARLSTGPTRRGYRWLKAAMARHVLGRARHVTAVSPHLREQVAGWCKVPVAVVPNPVAPAAYALQRSPTAPPGARVCMVCNGWSDFKNPQAGLRAFSRFSRTRGDAELVVCGDQFEAGGPAQAWWRAQALPGRVSFRGRLPHVEVLSEMARSDVLLHPSREESFGVAVAEAMAMGLPVVAGRTSGALPWLLDGAGFLADVDDVAAIEGALARAVDRPRLARRLASRGRRRALASFSPSVVSAGYELHYRAAAGHADGHGGAMPALDRLKPSTT